MQSIADLIAQSSDSDGNEDDFGNGSIDNVDHGSFGDVLDDGVELDI